MCKCQSTHAASFDYRFACLAPPLSSTPQQHDRSESVVSGFGQKMSLRAGQQREATDGNIQLGTQPGQARQDREALHRAFVDSLKDNKRGLETCRTLSEETCLSTQGVVEVSRGCTLVRDAHDSCAMCCNGCYVSVDSALRLRQYFRWRGAASTYNPH